VLLSVAQLVQAVLVAGNEKLVDLVEFNIFLMKQLT
jgi:hypothetical protein